MLDTHLLKTLAEAWGPPGYEHAIRATIQAAVANHADEVYTDASGALVCRVGSVGPKVMVAAHMDEIGFFIHHIDRRGYARFSLNGSLFPLTLMGARVRLEDGTLGVVAVEKPYAPDKVPAIANFYIDFPGVTARPGMVGAIQRDCVEQNGFIIGKSLDDRAGCAVLIETLRRLQGQTLPNQVYFVFTTQEEVGIRGARTSAFGIDPQYAIAVDLTLAGDQAGNEALDVRLGAGTAIKARDAGHIVPPAIKELMIRRAEAEGIPYQIEVLDLGTTDAAAIQVARSGIPSGAISIPARNVHSASEMIALSDLEASVALLTALLAQPFTPNS